MTFYMEKDVEGQWRWALEATNHKKIANSGEGYHNEQDCRRAIELVMDTNRETPVSKR